MSMGELGSLSVPVVLQSSGFDAALTSMRSRMQSFAGTITRLAKSMVLPSLGGGLAGGYLVKQAADLERSFSQLRKTTGLMGEPLAKLKGELKAMAAEMSGVSLESLLGIATMGGRMGIVGGQLNRFTRDIAMVSVALDDIPAEESATSIARLLNVYKLGSENAIRFASALNKLDDSSTATGRDILDISTRMGPAAATLGLVPQKVLAIAAALKDAGASNEVAGTAMSQVLGLMAKNTKEFAKVAEVSLETFTAAMRRDPLEAIKLLSAGIAKLDNLDAFEALSTLGIDGQRATMTLLQLGQVVDKLDGYVATANSEWKTTASIFSEVAISGSTTHAQLTRLGNNVRLLAAELGDYLLPLVKALAGSFGELAKQARDALEIRRPEIEGVIERLVTNARYVGLAFTHWSTLIDLAGERIGEFGDRAGTVLSRVGGSLWEGLKAGAGGAMQFLRNVFTVLGNFLADIFTQVGANLKAQMESIYKPRTKIPKIVPNFSIVSPDKFAAGLAMPKAPMPEGIASWFGRMTGNLPNRAGAIKEKTDVLDEELRTQLPGSLRKFFDGFIPGGPAMGLLGAGAKGVIGARAQDAMPKIGDMIFRALKGTGAPETKAGRARRRRGEMDARRRATRAELQGTKAAKREKARRLAQPGKAGKDEKLKELERIRDSNEQSAKAAMDLLDQFRKGIAARLG